MVKINPVCWPRDLPCNPGASVCDPRRRTDWRQVTRTKLASNWDAQVSPPLIQLAASDRDPIPFSADIVSLAFISSNPCPNIIHRCTFLKIWSRLICSSSTKISCIILLGKGAPGATSHREFALPINVSRPSRKAFRNEFHLANAVVLLLSWHAYQGSNVKRRRPSKLNIIFITVLHSGRWQRRNRITSPSLPVVLNTKLYTMNSGGPRDPLVVINFEFSY
jgi:hypothetical protein